MSEHLTGTELAKRWGISPQSVGHRAKESGFPVEKAGKSPRYPWPEVNDWWTDRCVRKAVSGQLTGIEEAKRRKMVAEAELAEIERDKAVGRVLDASEVEARWETVLLRVRAKLVARPAYEAPRLAMRPVKEVRAELEQYTADLLTELREDRGES